MKIQLVGPSYQQRSLPFDAQRTINLIPLVDKQGADVTSFIGTPGLELFCIAGTGPIRGSITASNNIYYVVSGQQLYEISSLGVATSRGSLNTSSGAVTMAENGNQLAICDGNDAYIYTYASNAFTQITDPDFPSQVGGIDFVDGYFIVNEVDTGRFYISGLYDGLSWDPLDFNTAASSPDKLIKVFNFVGQLGLLGQNTLEIWRNTGDSVFPFSRISGSTPIGTLSPHTVISIDGSVYWVGNTPNGGGTVYRAQGYSPVRISTDPIERILQKEPNPELLRSWAYQQDGLSYLVITGGSLETSLVYEISTKQWHERSYLNQYGGDEQHRGSCCSFAYSKYLVGDRTNGNIYNMSMNVYSDNGSAILRRRIYTHLIDEMMPVRYSQLQIGFEVGVGLQNGQGSNPLMSLRISRDGARTWSNYYTKSIGASGKYTQEVTFRRLGIQQICTFELSISDPVKVAITGSYLK